MAWNQIIAGMGRKRFTRSSDLRWKVARMITTNSLAAFTQEVTRNRPLSEPKGVTEASPARRRAPTEAPAAEQVAQRRLEAVPPAPGKPLPRGSLLDLRV